MKIDGYRAIVIGVGRSSEELQELPGARRDARDFAGWAAAQGYTVDDFIDDEGREISVGDIKKTIRTLLDEEELKRLILFFSGHGTSLPSNDFWLLSGFGDDGDQCINVDLSISTARGHPIPQIAVIADACRSSIAATHTLNGGNLFPTSHNAVPKEARVDQFFAARRGLSAQEVPAAQAQRAYGIFSSCVLDALKGAAPAAFARGRDETGISSQSLATWLEDEMPLRSGRVPGGAVQFPSVLHGWDFPDDWYLKTAADEARRAVQVGGTASSPDKRLEEVSPAKRGRPGRVDASRGGLLHFGSRDSTGDPMIFRRSIGSARIGAGGKRRMATGGAAVAAARAERQGAVDKRAARILDSVGRQSFESHQGFTVDGAAIVGVAVGPKHPQPDFFAEQGHWHVRCDNEPQSIAIELDDGTWVATAALPDFIGTIIVDDGRVLSINFAGSKNADFRAYDGAHADRANSALAQWTAMQTMGVPVPPAKFDEFARLVRQGKHANPSLGILAAYAYDQGQLRRSDRSEVGRYAADFDSVDSVARFMASENGIVPFDVAFLSSTSLAALPAPLTFVSGKRSAQAPVAGSFPMMTQGWGLLERGLPGVNPRLLPLARGLRPGLWTSFAPDAGGTLATMIRRGELP